MSATRAETYLTLPTGYANSVGGLRWSATGDAVERWNGTTLALTEEFGVVLEGVFSHPAVPPFVVVLHVLHLMRSDDSSPVSARLRAAYRDAAGAAALYRNTGVLIAELCADVPPAAGVPAWGDVDAARTRRRRLFGPTTFPLVAEEPALTSAEVEARVAERLAALSDADLHHWLTNGCAPGAAGAKLAEEVESLPARVARLLAIARRRTRLVGAAAVVPAVDAALTLPPRRRSPDSVPQGGYCDVTTRGDPDRLLPSQFALDPDEFVRRFAERELLYFQREEPQAAEKPERLIVLDQGVRTWGPVRLALAAAAVVLLRKDARRLGRVLLAATSADGALDIATADPEVVADRLEASDLSASPAACWEEAVGAAGAGPRDVILLTHPRTARDPGLFAVPRRPGDRVFALTVDDHGAAELSEWGAAGPVPVRAFKVDLAAAEAARPDREATPTARLTTAWTGDVEAIGFPFRPGLVAETTTLGFDATGEWLVTAGPQGTLHGLTFDGTPPEVLPRAFHGGAVLKQVDAVLGLTGGVAVCGRLEPAPWVNPSVTVDPPPHSVTVFAVAYYDRAARRVTVHRLGEAAAAAKWGAFPDLNCVAVRPMPGSATTQAAVDLTTGDRSPFFGSASFPDRLSAALKRTGRGGSPPFAVPVLTALPVGGSADGGGPFIRLKGNTVQLWNTVTPWQLFEPQRDGKPLLGGTEIVRAQHAGDVLALALRRGGERTLTFFHGPDGRIVGEVPHPHSHSPFTLSADGGSVARLKPSRAVVVGEIGGTGLAIAAPAGLHNNLDVRVTAPFRLVVQVGGYEHQFAADDGVLTHTLVSGKVATSRRGVAGAGRIAPQYDPARFPPQAGAVGGRWAAVLDRLGQVLLFAGGEEPVAALLVRRELAAAWTPAGVFWGSPALIGGPATADAARLVGRAIQAAGRA